MCKTLNGVPGRCRGRASLAALLAVVSVVLPARAAAGADDAAVKLWVSSRVSARVGERQSWSSLLGLSIAFDRVQAPALPVVALGPTASSLAQEANASAPNEASSDEPAAGDTNASGNGAGGAESQSNPAPARWQLSNGLIQGAVRAALRHHGIRSRERRLDSLRARSRSSAALPELRLGAGRSTDQSIRLSPTQTDPYHYTQAGGADLWLEARVSWRLDRLLFAREELAIERLVRRQDQERWKCIRAVLDALYAWQKGLIEASDVARSPQQRQLAQLKALRAAAEVDTLTGGWFWEKAAAMVPTPPQGG